MTNRLTWTRALLFEIYYFKKNKHCRIPYSFADIREYVGLANKYDDYREFDITIHTDGKNFCFSLFNLNCALFN